MTLPEPDRHPTGLTVGDLVVARNRKWNGTAHWVVPGRFLGEDDFGWWLFQPKGSFCSRPGAAFHATSDVVLLVPRRGDFVAKFYDDSYPGDFRLYIDLALAHEWRTIRPGVTEFHLIDMDLDVIRSVKHGIYIDDEDEFAEHRLAMGYPQPVVERIREAADALFLAVKEQVAPFNGTATTWFERGRQ